MGSGRQAAHCAGQARRRWQWVRCRTQRRAVWCCGEVVEQRSTSAPRSPRQGARSTRRGAGGRAPAAKLPRRAAAHDRAHQCRPPAISSGEQCTSQDMPCRFRLLNAFVWLVSMYRGHKEERHPAPQGALTRLAVPHTPHCRREAQRLAHGARTCGQQALQSWHVRSPRFCSPTRRQAGTLPAAG